MNFQPHTCTHKCRSGHTRTMEKDGPLLQTDLYRKPTDRNTLLHRDSFHPGHLIRSLPISQFHRARRVCSTDQSYHNQVVDLRNRFLTRGYKPEVIENAVKRFESVTQEACLNPVVQEKARDGSVRGTNRLRCVIGQINI